MCYCCSWYAVGANVAAIVAAMGVGSVDEVLTVNVGVAVVGNAVAGSVADDCNNLAGGLSSCLRLPRSQKLRCCWMGMRVPLRSPVGCLGLS